MAGALGSFQAMARKTMLVGEWGSEEELGLCGNQGAVLQVSEEGEGFTAQTWLKPGI